MGSEKKHIIYTSEDIQKYFSGNLTPAEMHAMEKAALDDSLLAEAMEGYGSMQENDWNTQLKLLRDNFSKGQTSKVIAIKTATRYTMWKVAAATLIICSGIAITYLLTSREKAQKDSIAAVNKKQDPAHGTVAESSITDSVAQATSPITTNTDSTGPVSIVRSTPKPPADVILQNPPGIAGKREGKPAASIGAADDKIKDKTDYSSENAAAPATPTNLEQYETKSNKVNNRVVAENDNYRKNREALARNFTAQVIGPDGAPLPFANISIAHKNIETYTDAKGNFRLESSDSLVNIKIKSEGYISGNFTLKSDVPQDKLVLAEDEFSLKEKTQVAGKASAMNNKRRAALEPATETAAEPADGWDNYDTYITNNLSLSDEILQKNIHGEVLVSFKVKSDGTITHVKIDKSLCNDCDEAALRVIKNGPRWKIKKGNKAIVKVKIKF